MSINSRAKGKRGELEIAKILRDRGFEDARRGQQFAGGGDSPDVVGFPGQYHPEVKWVNAAPVYHGLEQAIRDAPEGHTPIVIRKQDRKEWIVVMRLTDFLERIVS